MSISIEYDNTRSWNQMSILSDRMTDGYESMVLHSFHVCHMFMNFIQINQRFECMAANFDCDTQWTPRINELRCSSTLCDWGTHLNSVARASLLIYCSFHCHGKEIIWSEESQKKKKNISTFHLFAYLIFLSCWPHTIAIRSFLLFETWVNWSVEPKIRNYCMQQ